MVRHLSSVMAISLALISVPFLHQMLKHTSTKSKAPRSLSNTTLSNVSTRFHSLDPSLSPNYWVIHWLEKMKSSYKRLSIPRTIKPKSADGGLGIRPIQLLKSPVPNDSVVKKTYARLASVYLSPFSHIRRKISRQQFLHPFLNQSATCTACALIQVRNGRLYVYDPRGVRALMAPFRAQRLREAVHWVWSAVSRGVVDDFEMVVSTMDSVATTCHPHHFHLPNASGVGAPIFTPITCNVSHNIPFPLMLADVLRRGLPKRFGHRQRDTLREWDESMLDVSDKLTNRLKWHEKEGRAVFRGSVRVSSFLKSVWQFDNHCPSVGRTALWTVARRHAQGVGHVARRLGNLAAIWPLPGSWFQPGTKTLLDVQVEGSCGGRVHVANKMSIEEQARFKYIVHAEGNSFWADRLLMTLFGTNAILKQSLPCGMFFEPLLRPFRHYIPVDASFSRVVDMTLWAKGNDAVVVGMVNRARQFAADYLSLAGVQTYVDELLKQYAELLEDRDFEIMKGAILVFP